MQVLNIPGNDHVSFTNVRLNLYFFSIAFPKNNDSNSEPACLVYFVLFAKRVEVLLLLLGNLWYLNRALAMPCSPMFGIFL
jgi:hypothetical protein